MQQLSAACTQAHTHTHRHTLTAYELGHKFSCRHGSWQLLLHPFVTRSQAGTVGQGARGGRCEQELLLLLLLLLLVLPFGSFGAINEAGWLRSSSYCCYCSFGCCRCALSTGVKFQFAVYCLLVSASLRRCLQFKRN